MLREDHLLISEKERLEMLKNRAFSVLASDKTFSTKPKIFCLRDRTQII